MSNPISRRELLKWASAGAGAAAVGVGTYAIGRSDAPKPFGVLAGPQPSSDTTAPRRPESTTAAPPAAPSTMPAATDLSQRLLVVVEMAGGNDGMSMVVPYGDGAYYDLRRTTAIGEGDVLTIDDQVGFHPSLPSLHQRGAAIVQGVGSFESDGSHFEMLARWWAGSPSPGGARDTGFLGRLADAIGDPSAPAVALSVGTGTSPAIISRTAATLAIPGADAAGYLAGAGDDDSFRRLFQQSVAQYGAAPSFNDLDARLRSTTTQSLAFAQELMSMASDEEDPYPYSDLGRGLRLAAQLFAAGQGVRIVHVPMHQDFDTHDDHNGRYPGIMQDLDESLSVFLDDLAAKGLSDRVLVMTTSEFGRTARDNDSGGLDHGTASNALLIGPVVPGRYGEASSLTDLDENDNLKATMGFDTYYATVAEGWFGVPASEALDTGATPLEGVFS
ncbi:MAG: DUF1501 domain-containing protein [Acidimicrobiales bacterium]